MTNILFSSLVMASIILAPGVHETSSVSSSEHLCLAKNIYHEAKNQPFDGMLAVGQVTLNRVNSAYWEDSICEVVYEGAHRPFKCQFSWACDKKPDIIYFSSKEWELAYKASTKVLYDDVDVVGDATHFHADYVKPYWADKIEKISKIGNHIFYKETR